MNMVSEFLQSEEWLRFQTATGKTILRCTENDLTMHGVMQQLPLIGSYLYVPRGPVWTEPSQKSDVSFETLLRLAQEHQACWIRVEPQTDELLTLLRSHVPYTIRKAPHDIQPREILVMEIVSSETELLAAMKSKTRYNIRLAEKHGVSVRRSREARDVKAFLDLIVATSGRKDIMPHPRSYYETMLQTFPEEMCQLFVAEYQGAVLAANMMIFFGKQAIYLHGGSSDKHRDVMAPYLLHWEQIKYAKERGCTLYDWGGIRTDDPASSWAGLTKFKQGFAPRTEPVLFPGTYDIVLSPWRYRLYRILRLFQGLKKYLLLH